MSTLKKHGGARPGSGRRNVGPRVTVQLRLRPETRAKLGEVAKREMLSKSELADIVLRETLK